jgi:hypothetical protein
MHKYRNSYNPMASATWFQVVSRSPSRRRR